MRQRPRKAHGAVDCFWNSERPTLQGRREQKMAIRIYGAFGLPTYFPRYHGEFVLRRADKAPENRCARPFRQAATPTRPMPRVDISECQYFARMRARPSRVGWLWRASASGHSAGSLHICEDATYNYTIREGRRALYFLATYIFFTAKRQTSLFGGRDPFYPQTAKRL